MGAVAGGVGAGELESAVAGAQKDADVVTSLVRHGEVQIPVAVEVRCRDRIGMAARREGNSCLKCAVAVSQQDADVAEIGGAVAVVGDSKAGDTRMIGVADRDGIGMGP